MTPQETTITKAQAIQMLKTLSALESWAFAQGKSLPDYLIDDVQQAMNTLEGVLL